MPVTQEQLDQMTCAIPGCTHEDHDGLWLHASCHPESPVWAFYNHGVLHLMCAECNKNVVNIAVAEPE